MTLTPSIQSFSFQKEGNEIYVLGLGTDQWMYQFNSELDAWIRLSKHNPATIMLAENTVPVETSVEPQPEMAPEAPVEATTEASVEPAS